MWSRRRAQGIRTANERNRRGVEPTRHRAGAVRETTGPGMGMQMDRTLRAEDGQICAKTTTPSLTRLVYVALALLASATSPAAAQTAPPVSPPIGSFDTPANLSFDLTGIAVTGWALGDSGIVTVQIQRDAHTSDPAGAVVNGRVFVGSASRVGRGRSVPPVRDRHRQPGQQKPSSERRPSRSTTAWQRSPSETSTRQGRAEESAEYIPSPAGC